MRFKEVLQETRRVVSGPGQAQSLIVVKVDCHGHEAMHLEPGKAWRTFRSCAGRVGQNQTRLDALRDRFTETLRKL